MLDNNKEKIAELLFEKAAGSISAADDLWLEQEMERSEELRRQWLLVQQKFQSARMQQFKNSLDTQEAWQKLNQNLTPVAAPSAKKKYYSYAAAAAVLLIAGFSIIFYLQQRNSSSANGVPMAKITAEPHIHVELADGRRVNLEQQGDKDASFEKLLDHLELSNAEEQWATLYVPAAKNYDLELEDGTKIFMNSGSSIRFPVHFSAKKREVYFQGEAYFDVKHNPKQPFIVHMNKALVEVLGTSFNISAYDNNRIVTSLVEGSIKSTSNNKTHLLKPGQEIEIAAGKEYIRSFDSDYVLSWRTGVYFFHNAPLAQLVPIIERWFDVSIEVENADLKDKKFSGSFKRKDSIALILKNLEMTSALKIKKQDRKIYFN